MASKSKQDLVKEGFTEFTIEDFHNTVSFHIVLYYIETRSAFTDRGKLICCFSVHGPDWTLWERAQPGEFARLFQQPKCVGLCGGVPEAAHLWLPAERAYFLSALHWRRTLREGILSAGGSLKPFGKIMVELMLYKQLTALEKPVIKLDLSGSDICLAWKRNKFFFWITVEKYQIRSFLHMFKMIFALCISKNTTNPAPGCSYWCLVMLHLSRV